MKNALRDKRVLLSLIVLIFVALVVSYLPWVLINFTPWFPSSSINRQYPAIMLYFFALVFFLGGYLVTDIYEARKRKADANYNGPLPKEIIAKKWLLRTAPYLASLTCLITGLITDLVIIPLLG